MFNLQPHEWSQRMGRGDSLYSSPKGNPLLWIHGSSVGETTSAIDIVRSIANQNSPIPIEEVLLTAFSVPAARLLTERAKLLQAELPGIAIRAELLPFDTETASRAFLERHKPSAGIFIESDVWPVLVREAQNAGIPLSLIDGRLSLQSFSRWRYVPEFARGTFGVFADVSTSTVADKVRLSTLGCKKVILAPSLKALAGKATVHAQPVDTCLAESITSRPAWIAGSTHPGEEEIALDAHRRILQTPGLSDSLLIVVPRHPSRACDVKAAAESFNCALRSHVGPNGVPSSASILVVDTLGELVSFYKIVRIALVGNTLIPQGRGHNICEAGAAGIPVVHGPSLGRFKNLKKTLLNNQVEPSAIQQVACSTDLASTIVAALQNPEHSQKAGASLQRGINREGEISYAHVRKTVANILGILGENGLYLRRRPLDSGSARA